MRDHTGEFTINHIDDGRGIEFEMRTKNPLTEQAEVISRWRVEIEEKAIHDALVLRGWSPPTTHKEGEDCSFECFAMIVDGAIDLYDIGIVNGIHAGEITSIHKDLEPYIEDMLEDLPSNCFVNFIAENITYDEGQQTFPETGQWDFPPHYEMDLSVVKIEEPDQLTKEAEDDLALHEEGES